MDPVFAIAIGVVILIIVGGLLGGAMAIGHSSAYNRGLLNRILDWMF